MPSSAPSSKTRWPFVWLPWFLGYFLLAAGWALATPYDGSPDEARHVYRAVGVFADGVFAREGRWHTVPRSLIRNNCFQFKAARPASCGVEPGGDPAPEPTLALAGRYNPVYYALVGGPLRLWPNWNGILRARLISALLVAALLAAAMHSAVRWSQSPFLAGAVLISTTPMTMHLAGAINPNSVEIAAGTAFFAALIPLLLENTAPRRAQLWVVGIAGALVAMLRGFGPLWIAIALAVLMLPGLRSNLSRIWRERPLRFCFGVVFLAVVLGVAWTMVAQTGLPDQVSIPKNYTRPEALRYEVTYRVGRFAEEMVGVLSWLDTALPSWFYLAWWSMLALPALIGFVFASWIDRWRQLGLLAAVFGIPLTLDVLLVNTYGLAAQGRYVLPIAVGLPMLAAFALSARNILPAWRAPALMRMFVLISLPLHLFALGFTMIRWQSGIPSAMRAISGNPFDGIWQPPLGSVLPFALATTGLLVLGVKAWTCPAAEPVTCARPQEEGGPAVKSAGSGAVLSRSR